jgi:hypothetical protein
MMQCLTILSHSVDAVELHRNFAPMLMSLSALRYDSVLRQAFAFPRLQLRVSDAVSLGCRSGVSQPQGLLF